MKLSLLAILAMGLCVQARSQEFPAKEFIMHMRVESGMITNFHSGVDAYTGSLQLIPQYTIVPNLLRAGVVAGGFFADKKMQGMIGPTISIKLKTLELKQFGSGGNLHLSLNHLWGTDAQKLIGGGLNVDLLNFIVVGVSVHRDYHHANWWVQGNLAFRISKVKKVQQP